MDFAIWTFPLSSNFPITKLPEELSHENTSLEADSEGPTFIFCGSLRTEFELFLELYLHVCGALFSKMFITRH